jgi:hypothetical protein
MWKTIQEKIQGGILAYWSQVVWFVLGTLLGAMLLGGLVSCTTVDNTWSGVKQTGRAAVDGAVEVGSAVVGTGEAVVRGVASDVQDAVDVVTGEEKRPRRPEGRRREGRPEGSPGPQK